MKKALRLSLIMALIPAGMVISQEQIRLTSGTMVMNGGSSSVPNYLVVDNPNANAILTDGGVIVSENEFNQVQWNIGTNTGVFAVPFGYSGNNIPVSLNINSNPGVGNGNVKFSTYHTPALNSGAEPSDVTNLNAFITPGSPSNSDNSYNIADRFFIIDENTGYTTKPGPDNVSFSYVSPNEVASPNVLTESRLMAQRFNSTSNTWSDWFGYGCTDNVTSGVGSVQSGPVTAANMFRSWSLWDQTMPLPLTVTNSASGCYGAGTATVTVYGGVSPYTYLWSDASSQTTATATGLTSGTYTVSVNDSHGCTSTISTTIGTQPAALTASATSTSAACDTKDNGTASVTASGGTPAYTYLWSNSETSSNISALSSGTYTVTVTDNNGCTVTASTTITNTAAVVATATQVAGVSCYGGSNGSAQVSVTGGTKPYTYQWSTGKTTTTITALTAGTYSVLVTDKNGCTGTSSVTVTQNSAVVATLSSTNLLCYNVSTGTASVVASGGTSPYKYHWSDGNSTTSITGLSAGTYTITVSDNLGCTGTASVTITQNTAVTVSISSSTNVSCYLGNNGSATASTTGGTSPYNYKWSDASSQATATATGLTAGSYTVTATDANGCIGTAKVTLTQPAKSVSVTTAIITNVSCNGGSSGSASATASGGTSPYLYKWSNSATGSPITGLTAGTYTVTATDNQGCTATATVTISQPTAVSAVTSVLTSVSCNGGSNGSANVVASGGTSPYIYKWSGGQTNSTINAQFSGTYTVTVTDKNGCAATASVTISQPTPVVATISSSTNVNCNGGSTGSATASGSGGTSPYTYKWSNAAITATITGLKAGTYSVTVTDNNGCAATTSVTISQNSAVTVSTTVTNVSCFSGSNGSATASATGGTSPYNYLWNDASSQATATATGLTAGSYTVTATDANGCTGTAKVTLTQPAKSVSVTTAVVTSVSCNGGSNGSASATATGGTGPYLYSWSNSETGTPVTGLTAGTYTVTATDNQGCTATATVTITQPSALSAITSVIASVACNGGSTGSAEVTASNGTAPYTYAWSGGQTKSNITAQFAGTYSVTVTDNKGCSQTASITISQPTLVVATISSSTNVNCYGTSTGSATVTGSGGTSPYTYTWSNAKTTTTITGLGAGTYTVTVKDNNGCTGTASVTISQNTAVTVSITNISNVACYATGYGSATASVSGGTSPYTYLWNDASSETTATATGLTAGTFTVKVTDNDGCTGTAKVTITQPAKALSVTTAQINGDTCNGYTNGRASATAAGGTSPYNYNWSTGATGSPVTGLSAGVYTVTASDVNGCIATATVTITQPAVLAGSATVNSPSCNGGSNGTASITASGGTVPYTYAWSTGATTSSISGLVAGTYSVTLTDKHGCSLASSITIVSKAAIVARITNVQNLTCYGNSSGQIAVTATGGTPPFTYKWTPSGGSTNSATGLSAGTYTVTVTDHDGCATTEVQTLSQPAALTGPITINNQVLCNGAGNGEATINVSGGTSPYTYTWSDANSQSNATATGLTPGTFTCTVMDNNSCTLTAKCTITQPALLRDSVASTTCNTKTALGTLTAGVKGGVSPYTYSWTSSNTSWGPESTNPATSAGSATYTITITDKNGCTATASISYTCLEPPSSGGGPKDDGNKNGSCCDMNSLNDMTLYPNPNSGEFSIKGLQAGMVIELYNGLGQKISRSTAGDEDTMQFNISTQPNGIYLVRIMSPDGTFLVEKKVVKTW